MSDNEQTKRVEEIERGRMSAQELSWSLRGVNRAAAEVDQALAGRIGLRLSDYSAMGHVMSQAGAPLGPAELGSRLGISTGSATELVDRLERAGHLVRVRDGKDRRRVSLHPSDEAVDRVLTELKPLIDSLDALTTNFTPDEQVAISRYLRLAAQQLTDFADALSHASKTEQTGTSHQDQ